MQAPVAAEISDALAPLRSKFPETRWLARDKLHLTLVFLGATDPARTGTLQAALADVAVRHAPFDIATAEAGGRPTGRRGGVAWLRIGRGADELSDLARGLDAALGSDVYGERHQPRPHLTVARGVNEATIAALREWAQARPPFAWKVDRVLLFRSYLGPDGSRYEPLSSRHLTARGQPA